MSAEDSLAWSWTIANVRNNAGIDVANSPALPWLIDRLGLRGAAVNVFVRKVGLILAMFRRIDSEGKD
jgi:hypothetical protein